ncbi:MAG: hypothetical protein ACLQU2_04025 [Candidatus Binataceae bacterium]
MRTLRAIWIQCGILLVTLVVLDILLRVYFYATAKPRLDWRAAADGYKNAPWAPEYFADLSGFSVRWQPFVYWLGAPYHSRYLNMDENGVRQTLGAGPWERSQHHAIRIFAFGGSTMWGEGSRDDYTIPSWLQRFIYQTPYRVRITNFGEDAYVNTQEVLLLLEQLQKGNIPDIVIFYDGYNDSASALSEGVAGVSFDESNRRTEFRVFNLWSNDNSLMLKEAAVALIRQSGFGQLAKRILLWLAPARFEELQGQLVSADTNSTLAPGAETGRVQDKVVNTYLANKRIVEALGRSFGFTCLFFWQATVYTKTNRTRYESTRGWLPGDRQFLGGVYKRIAAIAGGENIHDLSGVFGNSAQPFFIDEAHVTEDGNRIIAQAMLPYVLAAVKEKSREASPVAAAGQTQPH